MSDQGIAEWWGVNIRILPVGGMGIDPSLVDLRSKQRFDFGVVTAGSVKAAYIPRLRIKPFVVRFS